MSADLSWLKCLAIGDPVIVEDHSGLSREPYKTGKVVRLTPSGNLVIRFDLTPRQRDRSTYIFNRKSGRERTSARPRWLSQYTPEREKEIRDTAQHSHLANWLRIVNWHKLPLETLQAVEATLKSSEGKVG